MQAEEAVEINDLLLRDGNAGPHRVVVLFAMRNDDVEAVGSSALEDYDEAPVGCCGGFGEDGAHEKAGDGGSSGNRECAFVEEEAPVEFHDLASGTSGAKV